jgi:hypothetical protein
MDKEARRRLAIESVDSLIGDIESSVKRGAVVFGVDELLTSLIPSFIDYDSWAEIAPKSGQVYTGERRDLTAILGCRDWVSTFFALHTLVTDGVTGEIKAGDYFWLPIKANAGHFDGLEFAALDIAETELVVTHVCRDRIIFNFENILFFSAINEKNTNKGDFKDSALSQYLNIQFLDALGPVKEILAKNKDGNRVTLPTLYEVFGESEVEDNDEKTANWADPCQLDYFHNVKNRIRTKDNDTKWWWLSSAATSTCLALVSYNGAIDYSYESSTLGGVAPAICIL